MKLKDLFKKAVDLGIDSDPRGRKEVEADLARRKKDFDELSDKKKQYFDEDTLWNPYFDSRIIHQTSEDVEVKRLIAGIDMEEPQVHLAHTLGKQGEPIDLVLSHHPEGRALLGLSQDMHLKGEICNLNGVPVHITEALGGKRSSEVARGLHAINYIRIGDTARLLGLNYACTHTITDNLGYAFLNKNFVQKEFRLIDDLIEAAMEVPEYQYGAKNGNPIRVLNGSKKSKVGKMAATGITGGTSGHEGLYEHLSAAGVSTLLAMHFREKDLEQAKKYHLNVVVLGHMASDSIGMNLMLDEFEKEGVEILTCGMARVSRNK